MKKAKLTSQERETLRKVRRVIFANPFSEERTKADANISGQPPNASQKAIYEANLHNISNVIDQIVAAGRGNVQQYGGDDRELFEYGVLYYIYLTFIDHFDALIKQQVREGDKPCKVKFADDAIDMALKRGFQEQDALRYFAMSYQLRRAFFFINQIVGRSPCMKNFRRDLWNNIFTNNIGLYNEYLWNRMEDFSTMLLGETGTGKGMAAAAIGRSGFIPFNVQKKIFSESFTRVFIPLNLSQFPEKLLESELFGHKKGAFTGAVENHYGIFSRCSPHGSIFLDEIGEVSIPVQIKLLQVLQERYFSPVGSHEKLQFRGRVIAATNRSIESSRENGDFRDDFYYRLCSDIISVPPLRRRIAEDNNELRDLLSNTIERILGMPSERLVEGAQKAIKFHLPENYPWPGNVRELEQCVRRIILKTRYEGDFFKSTEAKMELFNVDISREPPTAQELLSEYCRRLYDKYGKYETVARLANIDRRTVKKYIEQ